MQIRQISLPPNINRMIITINSQGQFEISEKSIEDHDNASFNMTNFFGRMESQKVQLSQLNSLKLTKDNRLHDLLKTVPFPQNVELTDHAASTSKKYSCNCKRSKCLKLYCQCFSRQSFCGPDCSCTSCSNTQANQKKLSMIHQQTIGKRTLQNKGCRCQKSNCKKKYCECYSKGQQCTTYCECINCENEKNIGFQRKQQQ